MTITLDMHVNAPHTAVNPFAPSKALVRSNGQVLAYCDTTEEAEQAKRAFELVLAPRFTRDEAIAIVKDALNPSLPKTGRKCIPDAMRKGARLALEALAAAGVFVDDSPIEEFWTGGTMADKLNAAGIR